jgi:hypothetical protein
MSVSGCDSDAMMMQYKARRCDMTHNKGGKIIMPRCIRDMANGWSGRRFGCLRAEPDNLEQRQATDTSHGKTDSTGRGSEVGPGMACLKVRQRRGGWRVLERERGGVSQGEAVARDLSVTLSDSQ